MNRKRAVLAGFRGHSPRWFEFHSDAIDIVAVAGPVGDRVKKRMEEAGYDGKHYDDPYQMIGKEDAEVAFIWTPKTEDHVPLGKKALERGMHVMLEKPLSEDAEEAKRFVEAAEEAGRTAMIMQDVRWQNAAMEVKEALEEGVVGELYWLEVSLRGLFNAFVYEGIHVTDLARYWYGKEAEWVLAAGASPAHKPITHDNIIALNVGFAGGGVARVVMDWSSLGHQHWIRARLQGDRAVMGVTWGEPIQVQEGREGGRTIPKWTVECNDMKKLLAHFIDCIDKGEVPTNSARDHLKTLDIIYAGWESVRRGEVVRLPYKL